MIQQIWPQTTESIAVGTSTVHEIDLIIQFDCDLRIPREIDFHRLFHRFSVAFIGSNVLGFRGVMRF